MDIYRSKSIDSIKKQRHHFANKGSYSQSYVFSSNHVRMWEMDHKGGWVLKNWCFRISVLEKTLESPLDNKQIKPVNPKGNQTWIFTEAEVPILWPLDVKSRLICIDPDNGKDWGQEVKRAIVHERIGWCHRLNGDEFEQIQGDTEGRGSLVCCSLQSHRDRHDLVPEQKQHRSKYSLKIFLWFFFCFWFF